jgi:hypothetical protein
MWTAIVATQQGDPLKAQHDYAHPAARCLLRRYNQHTSQGKIFFKAMRAFCPQLFNFRE